MKKKNLYIILCTCLLLVGIFTVYAISNPFVFSKTYSTKEKVSAFAAQYNRMYNFNDGILSVSYEGNIDDEKYDEYKITYFDKEGKEIASKILGDYTHINRIFTDGTDVYYLWYNKTDSTYGMTILDKDFKELGVVDFTEDDNAGFYSGGHHLSHGFTDQVNKEHRYAGEGFGSIVRDGDYIYYHIGRWAMMRQILKINSSFNYEIYGCSQYVYNGESICTDKDYLDLEKKYFPLMNQMIIEQPIYYANQYFPHSLYTKIDEETSVSVGSVNLGAYQTGYRAVMKLNKNDEIQWEIINRDYVAFSNVKVINNYIVVIADHMANGEYANERSDILIYNMKGEIVQKISNNSKFTSLVPLDDGFLVNRYYTEGSCSTAAATASVTATSGRNYTTSEEWDSSICKTYLYTEKYDLTKEEDSVIENPNTKVGAITLLLGLGIIAFISIGKGFKKIKRLS